MSWLNRRSAASLFYRLEELWFDFRFGVQTAGQAELEALTLAGNAADGNMYLPAAVSSARAVLRAVPVDDYSRFTFIDLGSGKGRILLLAAEYPFGAVRGVEFAEELHLQAERNLRTCSARLACKDIRSVYQDAGAFPFPDTGLVLFLFNPFPAPTMVRVLANLERSLKEKPRTAYLVLTYPEPLAAVLAATRWLRLMKQDRRFHLFEAVPL